jgi:hypothetical protein
MNSNPTNKARRVWLRHYALVPGMEIDHKDRNPKNNSISNLRLASRSQNNMNRRGWGSSGEKNVKIDRINHRWQVKVHAGGVRVYANASSKLSAILAARLIRRTLHGEFAA